MRSLPGGVFGLFGCCDLHQLCCGIQADSAHMHSLRGWMHFLHSLWMHWLRDWLHSDLERLPALHKYRIRRFGRVPVVPHFRKHHKVREVR